MRLLTRTTRNVSPTEAGERLLGTLRPAIDSIGTQLASLSELREKLADNAHHDIRARGKHHPVARARDTASRLSRHPRRAEHRLGLADIVTERFDAGVRLGEALAKDMIATRIGPDLRMAVVGSPAYFRKWSIPCKPQDLAEHQCINQRMLSAGGLYAWELEKDGREVRVRVEGQFTFNNSRMIVRATTAGFGLGFVMEDQVEAHLADGRLVRVLEDWCPSFPGYHLYYPSRRQPSAAFSLLMETLRYRS